MNLNDFLTGKNPEKAEIPTPENKPIHNANPAVRAKVVGPIAKAEPAPEPVSESTSRKLEHKIKGRKFCIVTGDFSGLGWAFDKRNEEAGDQIIIAYKPDMDEFKDKPEEFEK